MLIQEGLINTTTPYKIFAECIEDDAIRQFEECLRMEGCVQGALMPDAHSGYTAPIGSVLKFHNRISPQLVGYDIGCGMCSILTGLPTNLLTPVLLQRIRDHILATIPIGNNRHKTPSPYSNGLPHTDFLNEVLSNTGVYQLGTLGGGNHFIELAANQDGLLAITIHSGSRGLGKKVAEYYMRRAAIVSTDEALYAAEFDSSDQGKQILKHNPANYEKLKAKFVYHRVASARLDTNIEGYFSFDIYSQNGQDYLKDMNFALQYALDNRLAMMRKITKIVSTITAQSISIDRFINRNHNHAEVFNVLGHDCDTTTVIHRKGATHAEDGMLGIIPGNMRDGCFVVKGKGNAESMSSSSHGAGRVLSRSKAKQLLSIDDFHHTMEGIITNHTNDTLDEAPDAYKDVFEVMNLQKDLVEVIDYLKPILNIKG